MTGPTTSIVRSFEDVDRIRLEALMQAVALYHSRDVHYTEVVRTAESFAEFLANGK